MSKFNKLAALSEIAEQLEKAGHSVEAALVHKQFMKLAQMDDEMATIPTKEMSDEILGDESAEMEMEKDPASFTELLTNYAPTYLKLARVYPTRVSGFLMDVYTAEENYSNVKLVQELLLASPYLRDKSGLQANGKFGPNTKRIMSDLQRLLNKILFDGYAKKFKVKDKQGNILTIENANKYF